MVRIVVQSIPYCTTDGRWDKRGEIFRGQAILHFVI